MPRLMVAVGALLLGGAFLPPAPRVAAFTVGIIAIIGLFGREASRAAFYSPDLAVLTGIIKGACISCRDDLTS